MIKGVLAAAFLVAATYFLLSFFDPVLLFLFLSLVGVPALIFLIDSN